MVEKRRVAPAFVWPSPQPSTRNAFKRVESAALSGEVITTFVETISVEVATSHSRPRLPCRLPAAALCTFASLADWQDGIPFTELLERVNRVTESFPPPHRGPRSGAGRVKQILTERSFRHYQTLGCLNPPIKTPSPSPSTPVSPTP